MHIITLGPKGTFSHAAAQKEFSEADIELATNFDMLFDIVKQQGKLGFVPFENSLHGSIDEVLDLLVTTDVHVWKIFNIAVHHSIGATDPDSVTTVASHPQALSQCRAYLKERFPNAERFPVISTAYAINLALEDPTIAAIASTETLQEHGLEIIDQDIQGEGNTTRFAVIAKNDPFPDTERREMGIVFHPTGDHPGLLHDILSPFKIYNVNFTRIENRPTGKGFGDYLFHLHFEGSQDNARVQQALKELEEMDGVHIVKVLGEW